MTHDSESDEAEIRGGDLSVGAKTGGLGIRCLSLRASTGV